MSLVNKVPHFWGEANRCGHRNILRHEYHDTYPTVLWDTCRKDLTPLKEAVLRMAAGIDGR